MYEILSLSFLPSKNQVCTYYGSKTVNLQYANVNFKQYMLSTVHTKYYYTYEDVHDGMDYMYVYCQNFNFTHILWVFKCLICLQY